MYKLNEEGKYYVKNFLSWRCNILDDVKLNDYVEQISNRVMFHNEGCYFYIQDTPNIANNMYISAYIDHDMVDKIDDYLTFDLRRKKIQEW